MKKIEVYDPAMCCSTGVCGPSIDPNLLRVATVLDALKNKGFNIMRYNLSEEPNEFIENEDVSALLKARGVEVLPITFIDGKVVKAGAYLTNEEFSSMLGVDEAELSKKETKSSRCCSGDIGCC